MWAESTVSRKKKVMQKFVRAPLATGLFTVPRNQYGTWLLMLAKQ